jgi:uncharacterized membrane protein
MMWDMHEGMGWWMIFAGIWMLLFWGGLILGVVWLVTQMSRSTDGGEDSALKTARELYARGEISQEEFAQISSELRRWWGGAAEAH